MFRIDENNIGRDEYYISSSDCDCFYKAKLPYYFAINQEMSGLHADMKGAGIRDLLENEGRTWMVSRTRMEIQRTASWKDTAVTETWPQKAYRLFAPRVVKADDQNGNPLFTAITHWVIMDMVRKRPVRPQEIEKRIPAPDESLRFVSPELGKMRSRDEYKGPSFSIEPVVTYFDIDYNRHVNNISYVNWTVDSFPKVFLDEYEVSMIDCHWAKQTYQTDRIRVETVQIDQERPMFYTEIIRTSDDGNDQEVVFEAETEWRRKS
ncbi:MAG: thioesterase [Candidatus Ornithospirochaeta sp.]|nr:thioesterase [Candidatus Ornithospirochaeta sp.]